MELHMGCSKLSYAPALGQLLPFSSALSKPNNWFSFMHFIFSMFRLVYSIK